MRFNTLRSTSFQFHKGSINTFIEVVLLLLQICFNSIKVRLIHLDDDDKRKKVQFQFHKGSINTLFPPDTDHKPNLFQFHKGSINTKDLSRFLP